MSDAPVASEKMSPGKTPWSWLVPLIIVLVGALVYVPYLEQGRLIHEEPRRALIAEHMMETGDYLVPYLNGEIYTSKPPLYNWLIVATSWQQGYIDEFSARINSVICLILLALLAYWGGKPWLRQRGRVFLSFAVLLAPEMMSKATLAEIELVFTLLVTLSIWLWFHLDQAGKRGLALWLLPCLITAFSFLAKREPALVFFYFSVAAYLLYQRRFMELFSWGHIISAAAMCGIIGAWLAVMIDRVGLEALIENSQKEVLSRGLRASWWDHLEHVLLYPLEIMLAAFPFSLFLIPLVRRDVRQLLLQRSPEVFVFAALAVAVNLPLYLTRAEAAVRYFLPMFPTLLFLCALLFEKYWLDVVSESAKRWFDWIVRVIAILFAFASVVLVLAVMRPLFDVDMPQHILPPWLANGLAVVTLIAALGLLWKSFRFPVQVALPLVIVVMLGVRVIHFDVLLPRHVEKLDEERNVSWFVEEVYERVNRQQDLPIHTLGTVPRDIWFYLEYGDLQKTHLAGLEVPQDYFIGYDVALKGLEAREIPYELIFTMPYRGKTLVFGRVAD